MSASELADVFNSARAGFERLSSVLWGPLSEALVTRSAPRRGERVLDACCGAGASALPAARAVGRNGLVDGVDVSGALLAQARAGAKQAGLGQVRLHLADVTTWTGEAPYDLVQCGFGVFFLPDMDAGCRGLITQLGPGGRFAVLTWAHGAWAGLLGALVDAITAEGRPAPPVPASRRAGERIDDVAKLTGWLESLGLVAPRVEPVPHRVPITGDSAWELVEGTGFRRMLDELGPDARERVRAGFLARLAEQGIDHLDASALVGVATRPG